MHNLIQILFMNLTEDVSQNKIIKGSIINMQVIDKPKQNILPLSVRRRVITEQQQTSYENLRSSIVEKKQKNILKKLNYSTRPKFFNYDINCIDEMSRKIIKKILYENISVSRTIKLGNVLLSNELLSGMTENVKPIEYGSSIYPLILNQISNVFKQFMGVQDKNIFIAKGEISQQHYVFFNNCFEVPHSKCCSQPIYLRIELCKSLPFRSFRRISKAILRDLSQHNEQKIKLICQKCQRQIIEFYGQENKQQMDKISLQKIQQILDIENQRKKLSIGIMVGSGKHKSYRLNGLKKKNLETSRRFNPESIFSSVTKDKKRLIYEAQTQLKTSNLHKYVNDFYPSYFQ